VNTPLPPFPDANPSTAGHGASFYDRRAADAARLNKRISDAAYVGSGTPNTPTDVGAVDYDDHAELYRNAAPGNGERVGPNGLRIPRNPFFNGA
jgi:hypothetical protein